MEFQPGHKLAHGGKRPGAGRKPDEFKQLFEQAARELITPDEMEKFVRSCWSRAKAGDAKLAAMMLDRLLGKVPQPLQHAGEDGGAILIRVKYDDPNPDAPEAASGASESDSGGEPV